MSTNSSPSSNGRQIPSEPKAWQFTALALPDVILVEPPRHEDARGWFSETYSARIFAENGFDLTFVQDNVSFSVAGGTVRGLHYQSHPFAQHKLVRVLRGRILDVAVDIRRGSATFGKHVAVELSSENGQAVLVPDGFAHGFVTLEAETYVAYKVTNSYAPHHDHGLYWADPDLAIDWGIAAQEAIVSAKDLALPRLAEAEPLFG
jgi:dTDP-4-dehydrorhamnose 3,5-epimerase